MKSLSEVTFKSSSHLQIDMGLFGSQQTPNSLTPQGVGGGPAQGQAALFNQAAAAAQQSGLASVGMGMIDQATGGMQNEDQVKLLYQLMAAHPNQVSLFLLTYPNFLQEMMNAISLVVKKELMAFFNSDLIPAVKVNTEAGKFAEYSSITDENIQSALTKAVPAQNLQMEVQQGDMQAMNIMNGHNQHMMMNQMQQQQMQQQQMYQQQMMGMQQPQRPGMGAALGGFGASLIRGSLGLPPAQTQAPMQQPGMYQPQM